MTIHERTTRGWALALVGAAGIVLGTSATLWWTSRPTEAPTRVPQMPRRRQPRPPARRPSRSRPTSSRAPESARSWCRRDRWPRTCDSPAAWSRTRTRRRRFRPCRRAASRPGPRSSARSSKQGKSSGSSMCPKSPNRSASLLAMRAELDAAHARLVRTEELVGLGSVSQQELESVRAEHVRHETDIEGARARLRLLGLSAEPNRAALPAVGNLRLHRHRVPASRRRDQAAAERRAVGRDRDGVHHRGGFVHGLDRRRCVRARHDVDPRWRRAARDEPGVRRRTSDARQLC